MVRQEPNTHFSNSLVLVQGLESRAWAGFEAILQWTLNASIKCLREQPFVLPRDHTHSLCSAITPGNTPPVFFNSILDLLSLYFNSIVTRYSHLSLPKFPCIKYWELNWSSSSSKMTAILPPPIPFYPHCHFLSLTADACWGHFWFLPLLSLSWQCQDDIFFFRYFSEITANVLQKL